MAPPYIFRDLQWTDEVESLKRLWPGSQKRPIDVIVSRTRHRTMGDRSFRVMAARAWKSLPTSVTTATSLASLKRQLKTFLFTKSFR